MEVRITWWRIVRFWWAVVWRHTLISFGIFLVMLILIVGASIVAVIVGRDPEWIKGTMKSVIWISAYLVGIISTFITYKITIGKRIGDFKVIMVKAEDKKEASH